MNPEELIAYFENKQLPESLRLDRATTQFEVKAAVERNIQTMLSNTDSGRARHRLTRIMRALETPYDGPEIPKL